MYKQLQTQIPYNICINYGKLIYLTVINDQWSSILTSYNSDPYDFN